MRNRLTGAMLCLAATAEAGGKATKTAPQPKAGSVAPAATPDKEAQKAAKAAQEAKDVFVRVMKDGKGVEPTKKLPPQAQGIVNLIEAAGPDGISRADLVKKMVGVITTKQPESRILSYYQKDIQERGCVKLQKATPIPAAS